MSTIAVRPPSDEPPDLRRAVALALELLADLDREADPVTDGRLERMLRGSLRRYESGCSAANGATKPETPNGDARLAGAAAAVRAACAFLATRSCEDAYLALRTATDHLRTPDARTRLPRPQ